ncbi:helix-turn-helix domain-containing protein [Bradyrhizobium sp. USDA 372]
MPYGSIVVEIHDRVASSEIGLTQAALAQLLGVRRTTVTLTMRKLRAIGRIISERRGALEVHRTRLENVACECYCVMRQRIKRMDEEELSSPNGSHLQYSSVQMNRTSFAIEPKPMWDRLPVDERDAGPSGTAPRANGRVRAPSAGSKEPAQARCLCAGAHSLQGNRKRAGASDSMPARL